MQAMALVVHRSGAIMIGSSGSARTDGIMPRAPNRKIHRRQTGPEPGRAKAAAGPVMTIARPRRRGDGRAARRTFGPGALGPVLGHGGA